MDQELPSNKQNDLMSLNNSNINFFFFFKYPKELDTSDCTKKIRVTLNAVVMNLADFKITHLKIVSSRCMVVLCILCILTWMSVEKPNELYSWNHMHVPVRERERERERERGRELVSFRHGKMDLLSQSNPKSKENTRYDPKKFLLGVKTS